MKTVILYHNPQCSKSRGAFELLDAKREDGEIDLQVREYLKNPLTKEELTLLFEKIDADFSELIRTNSDAYDQLVAEHDEPRSVSDAIDFIVLCPTLMQRPIAECGGRAVIGRPSENVLTLVRS